MAAPVGPPSRRGRPTASTGTAAGAGEQAVTIPVRAAVASSAGHGVDVRDEALAGVCASMAAI